MKLKTQCTSKLCFCISSPPTASISTDTEDIIECLQMEMANLRRQSADAISLSMRLSDQLSHAEAEKAEAQSALEATEMKLRDEIKKRKQAEREALNALSLRQAAEEALKSSQKFQADCLGMRDNRLAVSVSLFGYLHPRVYE